MRNPLKKIKLSSPVIPGLLVFLIILSITTFVAYQRYLILKSSEEDGVSRQATRIDREIKNVLNQGFSSTQSLAFLVENYGVPQDFSNISQLLLKTNTSVDALELVDSSGVITHVYPIEENEVLGFNILMDSVGKPGAVRTIEKGEYYIAGPINLKQGGSGFVCRTPIYTNNEFSGFAAAVIKLSTLLSAISLDSLEQSQYSYQLSKVNPDGSEKIFFSSQKKLQENALNRSITDYNGEWKLYVISNKSFALGGVLALGILGVFLSILAGFYTNSILERPIKLKKMVEDKTLLLRESEQKFKSLIEQASDGIFLTDFNGNMIDANIRGVEMFGYSKSELLKQNIKNLATNEELENLPIRFQELNLGQSVLSERQLLRKDKSSFYGEVSAKKLNDGVILGIVRDISERKEERKKLENKNRELKKTNSELDSFVYSASHELRAPLTSLLGLVDIMKKEESESEKLVNLNMMENSITRLDDFIGEIIQYSQNKHLDVKIEKINFSTLIDRSLEDLWYLKNTSGINVVKEINNKEPFFSDKRRVTVLLNNFISNAIKYHDLEKRSPSIWINVIINSKEASIIIKDNGMGIDKESQTKIYNMFYRATAKVMGSGIGLFIVQEILEKLRGSVSLESELNMGSTFTIKLPNMAPKN
ncbi:PAS domain S-box protein [Maribacter sp. PR1]|uniref:histidine kinase n=1 Tax=Maribacter cobaltidurans TaxID=1178778 RepID=A0ABU7IRG1_9FLAO|nr:MULTISPECIES: PAS domain S-box protein [Maribacter]MDC6387869.1 PAS domain S-box protein [Maribacter sp. PR1]MEE1975258.1 PAS domain S-box protein [Maribacter cobaltidurans]